MPRSDYSHWNEEADRVWWEEEGKHETTPPEMTDGDWTPDGPWGFEDPATSDGPPEDLE